MSDCKANAAQQPAAADPEAYCVDCGIQFMARETLLGHKKFYCSKQKLARGSDTDDSPKFAPAPVDATERDYTSKNVSRRSPSLSVNSGSGSKKTSPTEGPPAPNWMQLSSAFPGVLLPPPLVLATPILTNVGIQYVPVTPANSPATVLPLIGTRPTTIQPCLPFAPFGVPLLVPPVASDQPSAAQPQERSPSLPVCHSSGPGHDAPRKNEPAESRHTPPNKRQRCLGLEDATAGCRSPTVSVADRTSNAPAGRASASPDGHVLAQQNDKPARNASALSCPPLHAERASPKCASEASEAALDLTVRSNDNPPDRAAAAAAAAAAVAAAAAAAAAAVAERREDKSEFVCEDCNVTFHKRENYVAHRTLYCARRLRASDDDSHAAVCAAIRGEANYSSVKNADYQHASKTISQSDSDAIESNALSTFHQCLPCGIKFKSLRTLEAHREYYCPFRHDVSLMKTDMRKLPNRTRMVEQLRGAQNAKAARFAADYAAELKRPATTARSPSSSSNKQNDGESAGTMAFRRTFKCDFCDETFVSLEHLAEHLRSHAIPVCYSCKLCGYRGNTVRGLKIHGKLHADEGLLFTEENIAVIRKVAPGENAITLLSTIRSQHDPLLAARHKQFDAVGGVPCTAATITGCNHSDSTPAKQSRRKQMQPMATDTSDERHDTPQPRTRSLFTCDRCQSQFLDEENFQLHRQKICAQLNENCVADKNDDVQVELQVEMRAKDSVAPRNESDENSNCSLATPSPPPTQVVVIPGGGFAVRLSSANPQITRPPIKRPSAKLCRSCGVSFRHLTTYVSHKKYYCRKRRVWQSSVTGDATPMHGTQAERM